MGLDYGTFLSTALPANLHFYHALGPEVSPDTYAAAVASGTTGIHFERAMEEQAKQRKSVESKLTTYKETFGNQIEKQGKQIHTRFSHGGSVVKSICADAEDHNIDMLVITAVGEGGIKTRLMGSDAERILQRSPCDTLIIPPDLSFHDIKIKNILYLLESYKQEDLEQLDGVIGMAAKLGASVRAVHIDVDTSGKDKDAPKFEFKSRVVTQSFYPKFQHDTIVIQPEEVKSIGSVVDQYIIDHDFDFTVMHRKRAEINFIDKFFNKRATTQRVMLSSVPLLIVRDVPSSD